MGQFFTGASRGFDKGVAFSQQQARNKLLEEQLDVSKRNVSVQETLADLKVGEQESLQQGFEDFGELMARWEAEDTGRLAGTEVLESAKAVAGIDPQVRAPALEQFKVLYQEKTGQAVPASVEKVLRTAKPETLGQIINGMESDFLGDEGANAETLHTRLASPLTTTPAPTPPSSDLDRRKKRLRQLEQLGVQNANNAVGKAINARTKVMREEIYREEDRQRELADEGSRRSFELDKLKRSDELQRGRIRLTQTLSDQAKTNVRKDAEYVAELEGHRRGTPEFNAAAAKNLREFKTKPETVMLGEREEAKLNAKYFDDERRAVTATAKQALKSDQRLRILKRLSADAAEGRLGPLVMWTQGFLRSVGLEGLAKSVLGGSDVGISEVYDAVVQGYAQALYEKGLGSRSDFDLRQLLAQSPTLSLTEPGRDLLNDLMSALNAKERRRERAMIAYRAKHGRLDDGWVLESRAIDEETIFTPSINKRIDAVREQPPTRDTPTVNLSGLGETAADVATAAVGTATGALATEAPSGALELRNGQIHFGGKPLDARSTINIQGLGKFTVQGKNTLVAPNGNVYTLGEDGALELTQ